MSLKPAMFLTSALTGAGLIISPMAAQAGGMSHIGNYSGLVGHSTVSGGINCNHPIQVQTPHNYNVTVNKPVSVNKNIDVNKPVSINKNVDVNKPISVNKNVDVNKPVSVNKNIDVNKPITITNNINASKNINITKTIDDSKNIDINKPISVRKGGQGSSQSSSSAEADAQAEAIAVASAVAAASSNSSSSAVINFNSNNNSNASANSSASSYSAAGTVLGGSSYIADTPGFFAGGDLGTINVVMAPAPIATAHTQCTFRDSTVIKAIHAICFSADHHSFPASHMVGDTWINSGYEGEVARCVPGSTLKVFVGSVTQSNEGMATSMMNALTMTCGPREALRHYKDGQLKCAPVVPVPDCTERTNLRKWGTGDMFFSYVAKVCLESHQELVGAQAQMSVQHEEIARERVP